MSSIDKSSAKRWNALNKRGSSDSWQLLEANGMSELHRNPPCRGARRDVTCPMQALPTTYRLQLSCRNQSVPKCGFSVRSLKTSGDYLGTAISATALFSPNATLLSPPRTTRPDSPCNITRCRDANCGICSRRCQMSFIDLGGPRHHRGADPVDSET